jgi:hypothetical protein
LLTRKESWRQAVCARERDTEMARVERYKLILRNQGKGPNELYDYATDPGEHTNLADNDQYVSIRGALADEIQKWKVNYSG